jgi:hypothetical protein
MSTQLFIGHNERGTNFRLPLDLTTQSIAILAKRGVGKSYTSAVFCEELLDAGQVPVIIDPTGAHWGLKSQADGKSAGYKVVIFGGEHADLPLEEDKGEAIATAIVDQRFPAIIDLSLFRKGQVRRFMTAFLEALYRLNRLPLMLVVDEADDICPQRCGPEEAQMVGAMEDVVKRGRKKGLGCTLITQRPADLAKQVLTQCEMLVAMRLVHPLDIKAVMEWVNVHADKDTAAQMIESLPTLPIGTAWFWSPGWGDIFERVQIRKRSTFDSGATPKPGEKRIEPKEMAVIDLTALGEKIAVAATRAKERDPEFLKGEIRRLTKELGIQKSNLEHVKIDLVDQKVLDTFRGQLVIATGIIEAVGEKHEQIGNKLHEIGETLRGLTARISEELRPGRTVVMHARQMGKTQAVQRSPMNRDEHFGETPVSMPRSEIGNSIPKGELAVLTACAQNAAEGCTREQLTVLTGYKRSSRDAYIQRLKERGLVSTSGNYVGATTAGVTALGPNFIPLPTGDHLRAHWLQRLPEGERKILSILCEFYPQRVDRDVISTETGYKRSSRDAYIQRLYARRLIITNSEGVAASATLFS